MPGMPMPTMTTTDQGHPANHHIHLREVIAAMGPGDRRVRCQWGLTS